MKHVIAVALAFSMIVIFSAWADEQEDVNPAEDVKSDVIYITLKIDVGKGEIVEVSDGETLKRYERIDNRIKATEDGAMLLVWKECSPGHFCILNGRYIWCP